MPHSFHVYRFKTLESTNTEAKSGYSAGIYGAGAVIVAEHQSNGRGQLRTKWHDVPGKNLLLSIIIEPENLPAHQFFRLNEAVSIAISDILPDVLNSSIKWPNDIFLNGKKCAGILIETQIQSDQIKSAFIGIGINVNQEVFPAEFDATSLKLSGNDSVSLDALEHKLLEAIAFRIQQLQLPELLTRVYKNRLLGVNTNLLYQDAKGVFSARVVRVAEDGRLVLKVAGEPTYRYYRFKEVKLLAQ